MGGTNPYLPKQKIALPAKGYRMSIKPHDKTVEVDPTAIPYGHTGLPGSVLDIASRMAWTSTMPAAASPPARPVTCG